LSVEEGIFCCSGLLGYSTHFFLSFMVAQGVSNRSICVNNIHMEREKESEWRKVRYTAHCGVMLWYDKELKELHF